MQNIFNTIKTSSLEKYTSHFIRKGSKGLRKVLSVRDELETEQNCNILTPTLLAIAAFLGLLNRGPGTWFSFQHLLSNWSELPVMLYNNLTSTYFLRASQFTLNSTRRQSRLSPKSSTGFTCYLHRCISYFDSSAGCQYVTRLLLIPQVRK